MTQLIGIAKNTLLQTIRQPIYGIIVLVTLGGLAMAPSLTGWTLDDDNKLLRDLGLSTLLVQGLFLACFGASSVINAEIDDKTVLSVAAKPVTRGVFVLGKYAGVLAAVAAAHYLAGIAYYMVMRHGVLQMASESSDVTVLVMGPGLMLLVMLVSLVLNYVYDWRFLPTMVSLCLPVLTLGTIVLLIVDRDWKLQSYETKQEIVKLPAEISDPAQFKGIISFRPAPGEAFLPGHKGDLVRSQWKGPITEAELDYLNSLVDSIPWRSAIGFLADESRKTQGTEIFKSSLLILCALAVLVAIAIAASTRLGLMSTFLICLVALAIGLSADQAIRPLAESGVGWARAAYALVPNFQVFWMIDALSDDRVIPWSYLRTATAYAALYSAGIIAMAMAMFETREVG
jgi:hypothetical protein